jgi:hypothetical protein
MDMDIGWIGKGEGKVGLHGARAMDTEMEKDEEDITRAKEKGSTTA